MVTVSVLEFVWLLFLTINSTNISTPTYTSGSTQIFNATANSPLTGYKSDTIICSNIACHIICAHQYACRYTKIDAFASNSLILECLSTTSCSDLIIVHSPQKHADIICSGGKSCQNADFNASTTQTMNLNCSGYQSCQRSQIICPTQDSSWCTISCSYQWSCYYANIEATAIMMDTLTIDCSVDRSCENSKMLFDFTYINVLNWRFINRPFYPFKPSISFGATSSKSIDVFTINCIGSESCNEFSILMDNINITTLYLTCNGAQSCNEMNLDLAIEESVYILCNNYSSCSNMYSDIRLIDSSDIDIYIECTHIGSNLIIDGSCKWAEFHIYPTESITDLGNHTITTTCSRSDCVGAIFNFSILAQVTVNCDEPNSCSSLKIYGVETESLDLNCNNVRSCSSMNVHCPFHKIRGCSINCNDYDENCEHMNVFVNNEYEQHLDYLDITCPDNSYNDTCSQLRFYCIQNEIASKDSTYLIWSEWYNKYNCYSATWTDCCPWRIHPEPIVCQKDKDCRIVCANYSCHGITIDATDATSLTLSCSDRYETGCKYMIIDIESTYKTSLYLSCSGGCDYIKINALYADIINIDCAEYGCHHMQIWANYSNSLIVHANYPDAFRYNTIYASNSKYIFIECSKDPSSYSGTCYFNNLYLPDYGANTYFECYGKGCYNMGNIFVSTSVSSLSITINGCGQCASSSDCISGWVINCTSSNSVDYFNFGDCIYEKCECKSLSLSTNNKFYDNDTHSYCIDIPIPEGNDDSNETYDHPTNYATTLIWVFSILCCFIIICCGAWIGIRRMDDDHPIAQQITTWTETWYRDGKEVEKRTWTTRQNISNHTELTAYTYN